MQLAFFADRDSETITLFSNIPNTGALVVPVRPVVVALVLLRRSKAEVLNLDACLVVANVVNVHAGWDFTVG